MKKIVSLVISVFIIISCDKDDVPNEKVLDSIFIAQEPAKKNYAINEVFDPTGMEVAARYSDNSTQTIALTTDMLSYDFTTAGTGKTVTITFHDKTATLTGITVSAGVTELTPIISGFAPASARHGTTVTITGENFSTTRADNIVTFNNVVAVVESSTETELKVTVPKNMECSGLLKVSLGGKVSVSSTSFTYIPTYNVTTLPTGTSLDYPHGIAVDAAGDLYVSDQGNHVIRKITATGVITTIAGLGDAGHFADGPVETATFRYPEGLALDVSSNAIYVTCERRIRKISGGTVTTLAGDGTDGLVDGAGGDAKFKSPVGMAIDLAGNIYLCDQGNHRIRKVTPGGVVTTFAGSTAGLTNGTGTAAQFEYPMGVALDANGNLYVADGENHCIRKITPAGVVTIFAGSDSRVWGSDDGTGTQAKFMNPHGLVADGAGNLYVADRGNRRIRKITPAGVVSTIAGSTSGLADGAGATAQFGLPTFLAIDNNGNLYVSDSGNNRIRKMTAE